MVTCPDCQQNIDTPPEFAGQMVVCKNCGRRFLNAPLATAAKNPKPKQPLVLRDWILGAIIVLLIGSWLLDRRQLVQQRDRFEQENIHIREELKRAQSAPDGKPQEMPAANQTRAY